MRKKIFFCLVVALWVCGLTVISFAAPFTNNNNGTVTDIKTGLVWQQGEPGSMTWGPALSYCEGLTLGGDSGWRLPNIKELESLIDDSRYFPATDTNYFPNAIAISYWSSTTDASNSYGAWGVGFDDGYVHGDGGKDSSAYVRCVRGGQPGLSYNLYISKNGTGSGSVNADAGTISWTGNTGTVSLSAGSNVTLTAVADSSSTFAGWTGCTSVNPDGTCKATMNSDMSIAASFILKSTTDNCAATLSSSDFSIHIPVLDFAGHHYWVDFMYVPDLMRPSSIMERYWIWDRLMLVPMQPFPRQRWVSISLTSFSTALPTGLILPIRKD